MKKRHGAAQIVAKLRQADVELAKGMFWAVGSESADLLSLRNEFSPLSLTLLGLISVIQ